MGSNKQQQQEDFYRQVDDKRRDFYDFFDSNDPDNQFSYIEAALEVATEQDIDISDPAIRKFLTSDLKEKLRQEGEQICMLRSGD